LRQLRLALEFVILTVRSESRGDERVLRASNDAKPSVAVIISTFNEAESIGAVVAALPREIVDRVIVTDGTRERAQAAGAVVIAVGRSYGRASVT
jgi:hypothetical protein